MAETARTDGGEAKKEDGFNVNTWPRPEGSLCSSPDEIWELNDDLAYYEKNYSIRIGACRQCYG